MIKISRRRKGKRARWVVEHPELGRKEFRASSKRNAINQAMVRFGISFQEAKHNCTYRSYGKNRSGRPMPYHEKQVRRPTVHTPSRPWIW